MVVVDFEELVASCFVPINIKESGKENETLRKKSEDFEFSLQKEAAKLLAPPKNEEKFDLSESKI